MIFFGALYVYCPPPPLPSSLSPCSISPLHSPQTPSDSNELLAQVTSSFGGEIGSLLDSFGDFSMSSRPAATSSTSTTDQPSKTTPISSDQSTKKATSMTKSADQSSKLLTSSSDHSSGTLAAGRDTGPSPSSLSSVPQTRGSPAKCKKQCHIQSAVHQILYNLYMYMYSALHLYMYMYIHT